MYFFTVEIATVTYGNQLFIHLQSHDCVHVMSMKLSSFERLIVNKSLELIIIIKTLVLIKLCGLVGFFEVIDKM